MTGSPDALAQREAVSDLLGALAYGELTAFTRLAADARLAPTLGDEVLMAGFAASRFAAYEMLSAHLTKLGLDPEAAMAPFVSALDRFHDLTEPADWLEGLVKAYVGDGIARDFYREMGALLVDDDTRRMVTELMAERPADADFFVDRVRKGIAAEPIVAGRLALWARRLVGEALSQTQRAAAERSAMLDLVGAATDLNELLQLFTRVTSAHEARMEALALSG